MSDMIELHFQRTGLDGEKYPVVHPIEASRVGDFLVGYMASGRAVLTHVRVRAGSIDEALAAPVPDLYHKSV